MFHVLQVYTFCQLTFTISVSEIDLGRAGCVSMKSSLYSLQIFCAQLWLRTLNKLETNKLNGQSEMQYIYVYIYIYKFTSSKLHTSLYKIS